MDQAIEVVVRDYVRVLDERELIARCAQGIDGALNDMQRAALRSARNRADVSAVLQTVRFAKAGDAEAAAGQCIEKMIERLDPFTDFLPVQRFSEMRSAAPRYAIGIEVQAAPTGIRIIDVHDGGPAALGGLRTDDVITHIDGKALASLALEESVGLLRGPLDSTVELTLLRQGRAPQERLALRRAQVRRPSAVIAQLRPNGVGYIAVDQLLAEARTEVLRAIQRLRTENGAPLRGLVLDLRWCSGGLLRSAIGVAAIFLPADVLVVQTKGRAVGASSEFRATPNDFRAGSEQDPPLDPAAPGRTLPLVVLTSPRTAAGGEILAGALRDHGRARLFGETTGGFGTIQTLIPIGPAAVRLTTASSHTPRGGAFDTKGIAPDVVVEAVKWTSEMTAARIGRKRLPEAGDKTLEAAVAALPAAGR